MGAIIGPPVHAAFSWGGGMVFSVWSPHSFACGVLCPVSDRPCALYRASALPVQLRLLSRGLL